MGPTRKIRDGLVMVLPIFLIAVIVSCIMTTNVYAEEKIAEKPVYATTAMIMGSYPCRGAEVQLLDDQGKVIEEWSTDEDAKHEIEADLVIGKQYTLHQLSVPDNYHFVYEYDENENFDVHYGRGYDTDFQVVINDKGEQEVHYWYYEHLVKQEDKYIVRGKNKNTAFLAIPSVRTVEIGMETLGSTADPDEYFEVILDIPDGVPGQEMNVDLSNADASKNPSQLVIPESGSLKASFWLKDGQSVTVDGFPLLFANYYSLYEDNEKLNEEAYITRILTAEKMGQVQSDEMIIQGIGLIGKNVSPANDKAQKTMTAESFMDHLKGFMMPLEVYAQDEIIEYAYEIMTSYASKELLSVDDPVVDTSVHCPISETLGILKDNNYTVSDSLNNGTSTTRTASKQGRIKNNPGALININGVFGDGKVLFINRRDGIPVAKVDDGGNPVEGSELEILTDDEQKYSVHTFTTTDEESTIVALPPGDYILHEKKAPENYDKAEDMKFTVIDQETVKVNGEEVDAVTMTDKAYVDIDVTKEWKDSDDKDGLRPEEVTVKLLADGEDTGKELVLKESGKWTGSFEDLDKYKDGEEIEYTVEEITVEGYETEYSGDAEEGITVTNTHKTESETVGGEEDDEIGEGSDDGEKDPASSDAKVKKNSDSPGTGDNTPYIFFAVFVLAIAALVYVIRRRRTEK